MNDEPAISRLRKSVIAQKSASLAEPDDPKLVPLYDLLHQLDEFVTQVVFAALQGQQVPVEFPAQAELDDALSISQSFSDPLVERALRQYVRYHAKLDEMLQLATQVMQDNTQG